MRRALLILASSGLFVGGDPLDAQATGEPLPWAAFLGCWSASSDAGSGPLTCFVPVAGQPAIAERLFVRGETVLERARLDASGRRVEIDAETCGGWESARFSNDGARVYTRGEASCADVPPQGSSGIVSIAPTGDLVLVSTLRVGDQRSLRVQRLRALPWLLMPDGVRATLDGVLRRVDGARVSAAKPLSTAAIVDVAAAVDAYAAEAWMVESSRDVEGFRTTRSDLQRLAAARVPGRVIDMAVILGNPQAFRVALERDVITTARVEPMPSAAGSGMSTLAMCDRLRSSLWMMDWMYDFPMGAWGPWGTLGFPMLGMSGNYWLRQCAPLGFYSRWSMSGFWVGQGFQGVRPGFVGVPVRVDVSSRRIPASGGRVVKGEGYSQGSSGSTRTASSPRPSSSSGALTRSAGSSGSVRSGGSGGSTTGRTAKPRTP
ncbi:MAG: hypothetical protein KF689_06805 [Gemmatimonadaceae bacterium]|nr:hypothetical protein [Gemmatimonadaceae bacterium]MCW5825116.1 hypothetical protein [Gemmatimonadaceae bacterium]